MRCLGASMRGAAVLLPALMLAACVTDPAPPLMDFSALASADRVHVDGRDATGARLAEREVTDPAQIAALYRVVASRPDGWYRPWPQMPATHWNVTFSRGGRELGAYRVGSTVLASGGYARNVAGADLREVVELLRGTTQP